MARCSCISACSCLIEGSPDAECIQVTVTGNGALIPYEISADPIFDPTTDDCLNCGPNGFRLLLDPDGGLTCGPSGLAGSTGGGSAPFLVVAASDTDPNMQARADYVCDGIDDQVEINQAIIDGSTPASFFAPAGVLLLGGTYFTSDTISVFGQLNLLGSGRELTTIYFDGNGDAVPGDWAIEVTDAESKVADFLLIVSNNSGSGYRGGITQNGTESGIIERVYIQQAGDPITQPIQNAAIKLGGAFCTMRDCRIDAFDSTGVDLSNGGQGYRVESNWIAASTGIAMFGTAFSFILNNWIYGVDAFGTGSSPFVNHVGGAFDYTLGCGISIYGSIGPDGNNLVTGNRISHFARSGIMMDSCQRQPISGNNITAGSGAEAGAAGIFLRTNVLTSNIQNNVIRGTDFTYGIRIDDLSDADNFITNNDLLASGATEFSDAGSGTIIGAGNRF